MCHSNKDFLLCYLQKRVCSSLVVSVLDGQTIGYGLISPPQQKIPYRFLSHLYPGCKMSMTSVDWWGSERGLDWPPVAFHSPYAEAEKTEVRHSYCLQLPLEFRLRESSSFVGMLGSLWWITMILWSCPVKCTLYWASWGGRSTVAGCVEEQVWPLVSGEAGGMRHLFRINDSCLSISHVQERMASSFMRQQLFSICNGLVVVNILVKVNSRFTLSVYLDISGSQVMRSWSVTAVRF